MKTIKVIACGLLLVGLLAALLPVTVGAQDSEPTSQDANLELTAEHTRLESIPSDRFEFQVFIKFTGQVAHTFDLAATGPGDWQISITPRFSRNTKIGNIRLEPGVGEAVVLQASAPLATTPGTYDINLQVTDADLQASLLLQVVITARYGLWIRPADGLLNARVQAGRDNSYTIGVQNQGTAAVNGITLSGSNPPDWTITFSPERVDTLAAGGEQRVKVNIRPPENTTPGDYQIAISASGNEARANSLDVRVTVESPSIWGWVGIGIVVLVVIGLAFVMIRLGRR